MPRTPQLLPVLLCLMALPSLAQAEGFGINVTRLIYPQEASSITVTVRNSMATQPYLVQARVSDAQDRNEPAPFVVRPPLFRLEPATVNQLRVAMLPSSLPADRESVFYFHAGAIPASTAPGVSNQGDGVYGGTQFGVGNIIKLFYRPSHLPSSSLMAQRGLQFSQVEGGLRVSNPSAYFVSFASIHIEDQVLKLDTPAALMLAPFSHHIYPTASPPSRVRWQTINDEGGVNAFSHKLP